MPAMEAISATETARMRLAYSVRLLMGLSFTGLTYLFGFPRLCAVGALYFALSALWTVFLEYNLWGAADRFRASHVRVLLDVAALTVFIHLTGNAFSFLAMGFVVITALSSVRHQERLGLASVLYSSVSYAALVLGTGFGLIEPVNIVGAALKPGWLIMCTAPPLLAGFTLLVNRVVFTLYHRSESSREAAEVDRARAELAMVMAEKLRLEQSAYTDFARHLNLAGSLDEMLTKVHAFVVANFNAQSVLFLLKSPEGELQSRAFLWGGGADQSGDEEDPIDLNQIRIQLQPGGVLYAASRQRSATLLRTPELYGPELELAQRLGAGSLLAVPLFVQDQLFALFAIFDPPGFVRDEEDRLSLESFCDQVTGSLKSAVLRDEAEELRRRAEEARREAERASKELATLSDFTRQINSEGNLDIILNRIFEFIESHYNLDGIWLQFIDEEEGELYTYKTTRPPTLSEEQVNYIRGMRVPLKDDRGISTLVYHRKRPFYMAKRPARMTEHDRYVADILGIESCLYVPLIINEQTKAMISFTNFSKRMRLTSSNIAAIKWFCDQIAGAINNSRLHTESEFSRMIAEQRLEEVRRLKFQQDTDYYLTSNLIRPLEKIDTDSETVTIDTFTRQKKSFPHLRWHCEIGGDITQAASVLLKGRRHTVFMNADAMGKSIQGAGGVLVLGSVFSIIVDRTPKTRYQYPEQWLKNTYVELDHIFRKFEGSMYISLVMGLIDDATGSLYFINAEHPHPVLYRNGEARFVTPRYSARKLGFLLGNDRLAVDFLRLQEGDLLICGSDGRDDVLLPTRNGHGNEMNSDEELFLRHVETAKGKLPEIYEAIGARGSITDDLSLLSVHYTRGVPAVAPTMEPGQALDLSAQANHLLRDGQAAQALALLEEPARLILEAGPCGDELDLCYGPLITTLLRVYIELGDYQKGRDFGEEYLLINPQSQRLIHYVSRCARMMGDLEYAADCGERVLLRDPLDEDGLVHLTEVYIELGNTERANFLLEELAGFRPNHPRLAELQGRLPKVDRAEGSVGQADRSRV